MKIAVVGSGGREHAILWRLANDLNLPSLYALPGNGGTSAVAENIAVDVSNVEALCAALRALKPDLVVIGPEQPLADGVADRLSEDGILCFGPVAEAAKIEASKVFSKRLMRAQGIPTAEFLVFDDFSRLERYVKTEPEGNGWVVKADGLAAGKGAYVCGSLDETLHVSHELLVEGKLGKAGATVVVERKLSGREVSALYLCDGERYVALPPAQDYKRALDGDEGPNTGGMGCYCPATQLTPDLKADVERTIIAPVLNALLEQGAPYRGVLYAGLMLTADGPQVIEFNCRFGDPETQVILPVLRRHVFPSLLMDCAQGALRSDPVDASGAAVCVVLAADGYPDHYERGMKLDKFGGRAQTITFHAGTTIEGHALLSSGGRVLNAIGLGETVNEARENAYALAGCLHAPGLRYRHDIAQGV